MPALSRPRPSCWPSGLVPSSLRVARTALGAAAGEAETQSGRGTGACGRPPGEQPEVGRATWPRIAGGWGFSSEWGPAAPSTGRTGLTHAPLLGDVEPPQGAPTVPLPLLLPLMALLGLCCPPGRRRGHGPCPRSATRWGGARREPGARGGGESPARERTGVTFLPRAGGGTDVVPRCSHRGRNGDRPLAHF